MKAKLKRMIGTKEFYKAVMVIALPIMAQQFVTSFVNLIDNVMIGSVGSIALTSVTVANKFYLIYNSTLFGLCGASCIFIAQYYGADDHEKCQEVFDINLFLSLLAGLIFTLLVLFIPTQILQLFSKTPIIVETGLSYLKYIKYSYLPFALSMTVMTALRAVGINHLQLKIGIVTVFTNTFLNYILIFGHFGMPSLGVQGAAMATLIARLVELFIYLIVLFRKKHYFIFNLKGMGHLNFSLMKKMMIKAIPLTLNEIMFSLGNAMIFKAYIRTDEFLVAAISVVDTVLNIAFIVFSGLSSAVSILIGNKLGANQLEEARENSLKLIVFGAFIGAVAGFLLIVSSPFIPHIYHLESQINTTITTMLCIKGCLIPIYVINVCIFFVLRAGGDATSTLIMDSGFLWGANVLVSTVLSLMFSLPLIHLYFIVESLDLIKMFVATYFYRKGKWVRNMTVEG